MTQSNIKALEEQRVFAIVNDEEMSDEEKMMKFQKSFVKLTNMTIDTICNVVVAIETPQGKTDNAEQIKDFLTNCDKSVFQDLTDHLADINLPYSSIAREYLLKEGISADRIIKTGSPMNEVLQFYLDKIKQSSILKSLRLKKGSYFVVSSHREENVDNLKKLNELISTLNKREIASTARPINN